MKENRYDIIVIGSGLGGLLCGTLLSAEGLKVIVLEKNDNAGGLLRSFEWRDRIFDTGVHYFGGFDEGQPLRRIWDYLGIPEKGCFERMDQGFDMISFSGKEYLLKSGKKEFREELLQHFPGSGALLDGYLSKLDEITSRIPFFNPEAAEREFVLEKSMNAWRFFNHFEEGSGVLPKILSGSNFIYGSSREQTPLYLAAVINHSFISGAWRIRGGSSQVADHLVRRIRENGGEVLTGCKVEKIVKADREYIVSSREGHSFMAGKVISAIHPSQTLNMLSGIKIRQIYTDRICSLKNTPAAFTLFIALKPGTFRHLPYNIHHFRGTDTWPGLDEGTTGHFMLYTLPDENNDYAAGALVMTRSDISEYAKWEGTCTRQRGEEYIRFKQQQADVLLNLVEEKFPGFRQHIEDYLISTPLTWRDHTGMPGGSMFGIVHDSNNPATTWIQQGTPLPGFWFTGQNTNLHGVMGVTFGAVQTCGEILGMKHIFNKIGNVSR